jgi:nitrate reductase gamma subunit
MAFPYQTMLGLHILSVEILLILFPFTKLMHFFTLFIARWYNGAAFGRRGVQS